MEEDSQDSGADEDIEQVNIDNAGHGHGDQPGQEHEMQPPW